MQNDRITKLKIDNNPFAKGFRELGQSRIKRKLASKSPGTAEATDNELFEFKSSSTENQGTRKRTNSLTGSTTSADDSGHSLGDEISSSSLSGTSSPATSPHEFPSTYEESEDLALAKMHEKDRHMMRQRSPEWFDLMALRYIQQANGPYQTQSMYYPVIPHNYVPNLAAHAMAMPLLPAIEHPSIHMPVHGVPIAQPKIESKPRKMNSFSISAILGCES